MTENELKFKLPSRQAYEKVEARLGKSTGVREQVNRYYDLGEGVLSSGDAVFRLRRQNGKKILTFKVGMKREGGYFQAEEIEVEVESEEPAAWEGSAPLAALRSHFGEGELRFQGQTTNLRKCFPLNCGAVVELDQTTFPGGRVDYELEVETDDPDAVIEELSDVFGAAKVAMHPQTETKYARFLTSLRSEEDPG